MWNVEFIHVSDQIQYGQLSQNFNVTARTLSKYNPSDVPELGPKEWQLHLPNCPDYPDGYFDNENTNNIGT
jgi:hypothetical protein